MTIFKPRFLMSARERSRRDADYGEVISLRHALLRMNSAQRARELHENRVWAAETARQYFSSLAVLWLGAVAEVLVLVQAFALSNGLLLLAGILMISLMLLHLSGLEQRQSMYYGALRALQEFSARPESRFDE
jgi:hypothetical protein